MDKAENLSLFLCSWFHLDAQKGRFYVTLLGSLMSCMGRVPRVVLLLSV